MKRKVTHYFVLTTLLLSVMVAAGPTSAGAKGPKVDFYLTILHNNDGESQVINAGSDLEDFGGAARFKTLVDNLKWEAIHGPWTQRGAKRGVVMVSSGDNFLAGPEFNAGLENGVPFYDTIAMELIGYDAVNLGNHDFDFGPDVLADFIAGYTYPPPYVSANLDFSGEPSLQAYVDAGVIAPAAIVKERGELIGVIGLETPNLPFISSPRNVVVSDDLVSIVQGQIDTLEAQGVNKIILSSHLQSIQNEIDLVAQLDGVDVVIAGGGDELLADPLKDLLLPSDQEDCLPDIDNDPTTCNPDGILDAIFGPYPIIATDMDGTEVPVVTTSGEYRYVGKLVIGFNKFGEAPRPATTPSSPTRPCRRWWSIRWRRLWQNWPKP
jgi:2',3'-cyclic-nucleotide 2'-phosphodiesterase (5'-nucleotidase family)